jgi:inosine/xanthosine triphosphate pyrophosphatase family protein
VLVSEVVKALQLYGAPVQAIEVPGDHGLESAGPDVGEHAGVGRAHLLAGGTGVVVDVLHGLPAAVGAQFQAVLALTRDGQARSIPV